MKCIFIVILIILFYNNLSAQTDKEQAKIFFEKIVKSYFYTCDTLFSSYNDSITIVSPLTDTLLSSKDVLDTSFTCPKLYNSTKQLGTFESYLKKYYILVYNKTEFISKTQKALEKDSILNRDADIPFIFEVVNVLHKHYTDNDYLIVGSIPRSKADKVLEGFFWMFVRKTQKGWKIFGIHS